MVFITVEAYQSAQVHNITVKNKDYFWVKIVDVQNGLGLKCMCGLIRREICGIYETENLTKEQKRKYMRSKFAIIKHFGDKKSKYASNDIMEKVIKNCRGVKKSNDGLNKLEKMKMKYMRAKNIQC